MTGKTGTAGTRNENIKPAPFGLCFGDELFNLRLVSNVSGNDKSRSASRVYGVGDCVERCFGACRESNTYAGVCQYCGSGLTQLLHLIRTRPEGK